MIVILAALGWWQWERSWKELESTAAAAPAQDAPLTVPPEIMNRHVIFKTDPVYPDAARRSGIQGAVVMEALIGREGTIKRLTPVSGPDVLVQAASSAVESWKFEPYLFDGRPRDVETTITVEFRLK